MKNILLSTLCIIALTETTSASFLYEEIDPICSISGTTHTSFPGEISDTSSWSIPKAYDGECDEVANLSPSNQIYIYNYMIAYYKDKNFIEPASDGFVFNAQGQNFVKDTLFPAVQNAITKNRQNTKAVAVYNNLVKMIGYDYFIQGSSSIEYLGLTETEARTLAENNNVDFRVGAKDGEDFAVTADYVPGRITATIEDGIVVDYSIE